MDDGRPTVIRVTSNEIKSIFLHHLNIPVALKAGIGAKALVETSAKANKRTAKNERANMVDQWYGGVVVDGSVLYRRT